MMTNENQKAMKLSCLKCNYNLTVTEGLGPWAEAVMEKHFRAQHALTYKEMQEKERPER